MLSRSIFEKLRKKYDKICLYREIGTDLSPSEAYLRIRESYSFLFESAEKGKNPEFSFLGISKGHISLKNKSIYFLKDVLKKKIYVEEKLSSFMGGIVGFVSYEMINQFEKLENSENDFPDAMFLIIEDFIVFNHRTKKAYIVAVLNSYERYEEGIKRIEYLENKLKKEKTLNTSGKIKEFVSNFSRKDFENAVKKAKEYIYSGDIFQVVLSRRIETEMEGDAFCIYEKLKKINPSPYMFYLDFKDIIVLGSSPEVLIKLRGKKAILKPIAGTRPRGKTGEEDRLLEREMLSDEKEKAEHIMLVDLGRNDLGRVCETGSVRVEELMIVERYSHVQHIVSTVSGILKEGLDAFDLFKASFPAGTVTGAPKIRAMEIIRDLEKEKREVYAGGIGYFSYDGDMDFAIAIRTLFLKGKRLIAQAGAGIVADSVPEREYYETERKLGAVREAAQEAFK